MSTGLSATLNIISTSPFNLSQNSCTICLLAGTASVVNLPILSTQIYQIQFVNLLSTAVTINSNTLDGGSLVVVITGNAFVNIFPNNLTQQWLILGQGSTQGLTNPWFTNGNSLTANGTLGSTDNFDVLMKRNNLTYLSLITAGLSVGTSTNFNSNFVTGIPTPGAALDATNKNYVDTSVNTALTAVSVKYSQLIGSLTQQTSNATQNLTLSSGLNNTIRVRLQTYSTNFTNFASIDFIMAPPPATSAWVGFGYSGNLFNLTTIPTAGISINSWVVGSTAFSFQVSLFNGATGWSVLVYN